MPASCAASTTSVRELLAHLSMCPRHNPRTNHVALADADVLAPPFLFSRQHAGKPAGEDVLAGQLTATAKDARSQQRSHFRCAPPPVSPCSHQGQSPSGPPTGSGPVALTSFLGVVPKIRD